MPVGAKDSSGFFIDQLLQFVNLLRKAGIAIGSDQVLNTLRALPEIDSRNPVDFYTCLHCHLIFRHEQSPLFEQAFALFWLQPETMAQLSSTTLAGLLSDGDAGALARRLVEALGGDGLQRSGQGIELSAGFSASSEETLRSKDFAAMSSDELAAARQFLKTCRLVFPDKKSRRFQAAVHGRHIDRRASFRAGLRHPDALPMRYRQAQKVTTPIVVLCDISGSMADYSRMFLHFMHSLGSARDHVSSFVFATRLHNISRQLRNRDVDAAIDHAAASVRDWSGGTRIASCLKQFNWQWSRRLLGQGATLILITDGLDRESGPELARHMERLSKSCRRLIWLNPLLRFDEFQPLATGIRSMLPYVDEFVPAHSLDSLVALGELLQESALGRVA